VKALAHKVFRAGLSRAAPAAEWLPASVSALLSAWRTGIEQAAQHWRQLSPRERRLLRILAVAVVAAALYVVAWRPAWRDVVRWQDELPQLRTQAAAVDALVREAQALKREQGHRIAAAAMEEALKTSLASAALGGTQHVDRLENGTGWRIDFDGVAAGALFDWLAYAPRLLHLRLAEARIARPRDALGRPAPARASGTLQLRDGDAPTGANRP
jgi:general secretion pathway protein M